MRLISLKANTPTFRPVIFNRTGLSIIIAEQNSPRAARTRTYNGTGKTLLFAIIDYCLGSNKKSAFTNHLKGWIFYLEIELESGTHVIARSADDANLIWWDEKPIKLTALKAFLEAATFKLPPETPYLSFRSLIARFLRFGPGAYVNYKVANQEEMQKEYGVILRNAFMLGLDTNLAKRKHELRKQQTDVEDTMKQLAQNPLFSELMAGDTVGIEIGALKEQAARIEKDLADFRVAENYHEIEKDADAIKATLDHLRRQRVKLEQAIAQIERSLKMKADLSAQRVYQVYEEAKVKLPDIVIKTVEEVLAFQEALKANRLHRLTQDRRDLESQLEATDEKIALQSGSLDAKLKYLGDHHALDEYLAVNAELSETRVQIGKLENAKSVREKAQDKLRDIKLKMAEQNIITAKYLESAADLIGEATALFSKYAKRMYGYRRAGLVIGSDDGENQLRYKIEAHIEQDAAEGINEVRVFCYDFTMLTLARGHSVKFLMHDSAMFGPIDPRQRISMLQLAAETAEAQQLQYIVTLNEHDVSPIRTQVSLKDGEFEKIFNKQTTIQRLSDDKPESKLLGINVDMNYLEE